MHLTTTTTPARPVTRFTPDAWDGGSARTTRCKMAAPYRVPAKHRATYDRLAALTGILGGAARTAILAEIGDLIELPPAAFSVVGPDEWILFADGDMPVGGAEAICTYAEIVALVSPPAAPAPAKVRRTTKGELVSLLNRLLAEATPACPVLAADAAALLANA